MTPFKGKTCLQRPSPNSRVRQEYQEDTTRVAPL